MISLTDYYQPLNLQMIFFFIAIFLFFDIVGYGLSRRFAKTDNFLRPVNWIFGLGLFVFIWFWLHYKLLFRADYIILSAIPLLLVSLPYYLKNNGLSSLVRSIKDHPWP